MQAMTDGTIRLLTEEQVRAELEADPEAEIYDLDGCRISLDDAGLITEAHPTETPPASADAARDLQQQFGAGVRGEKIAYRRE